jgi:hypothetical protein
MIFLHTLEQVLSGKKTQTRRPIKPDTKFVYRAGKDYAVQPVRGAKAVARFEALSVRKQPLGEMTEAEAVAEGFASVAEYQELWTKQYGGFDPNEEVWVIEFRLLEDDPAESAEA